MGRIARAITGMATALAACVGAAHGQGALYEGSFASGRLRVDLHRTDNLLTGTVIADGASRALTGTVADDRFTGQFEVDGAMIPLEGGMEGTILVVTSGGATHRLVRQVIDGNPLADPALSQADLPNVLTLPSGMTIRYPQGWTTQPIGKLTALVPTPTPGQLVPKSVYAVMSVPWPRDLGIASPEASGRLANIVGQFLPGLSREGEPETLAPGVVRARFSGPSLTGEPTKVHALARSSGSSLALILGMGDESSLNFDGPSLGDMLRTVQAAAETPAPSQARPEPRVREPAPQNQGSKKVAGAIDSALVGTWTNTQTHVSGQATAAIDLVYRFAADGTYSFGSRAAGGDANASFRSAPTPGATGTWTASGGILRLTNQNGQVTQHSYLFHDGQLVFKKGQGKYSFWTR